MRDISALELLSSRQERSAPAEQHAEKREQRTARREDRQHARAVHVRAGEQAQVQRGQRHLRRDRGAQWKALTVVSESRFTVPSAAVSPFMS